MFSGYYPVRQMRLRSGRCWPLVIFSGIHHSFGDQLIILTFFKLYIVEWVFVSSVFEVRRELIHGGWLILFDKLLRHLYEPDETLFLLRNRSCQCGLDIPPKLFLLSIPFIVGNDWVLEDWCVVKQLFAVENNVVSVDIHDILIFVFLVLQQFFLQFLFT
jgi:hypothetical protein